MMLRSISAIAIFVAAAAAPAAEPRAVVDYNRDVRPILATNCFPCHGFDENSRQTELRLDVAESAYATRDSRPAIVPGDPAGSEAWMRIVSDDPDTVMPPPDSHRELSPADKAVLKAWIEQGAAYAAHWSFVPPRRSSVPPDAPHPIDAFVRRQLAEAGLQPAAEADRRMLIRRVSLDLTGLPPSAEEVEAFADDSNPHAYEALVDRLLASPHYGERMALEWLDAARYADTNGFSIDGGRHMWLWRDWVIRAFNINQPYDDFLVEQLAGDLLPDRTDAQLIATGFQRNNMVTHEGGTIPEENLTNYNADRVKTLGEIVLGLTLACAQCHDHKFDPITQKDYYRVFAFFNSVDDIGLDGNGGVNPRPSIEARTVLETDEVPELTRQIAELEARLAAPDPAVIAAWEERQRSQLMERGKGLGVHPVEVLKVSTPNSGAGFDVEGKSGVRISRLGGLAAFDVSTRLPAVRGPVTGLRVTFHPVPDLPGGGWGGGPAERRPRAKAAKGESEHAPDKGTFVLTAISATADAVPGDQINLHNLEPIARVTASSWDEKYPPAGCLDPRNESGWSPHPAATGPVHLTATFAEPLDVAETPFFTVQLNFGHGRNLVAGHFELAVITGTDDGTDLPPTVVSALETDPAARDDGQRSALQAECAARSEEFAADRIALANLRDRRDVLTRPFPVMVMNVSAKPRETFVLNRGDYSQPTEMVTPGTPASLPPMPEGAKPDRLGLARWVVAESNPLTARVAVNRFWKQFFGVGLVATPADLGLQGEWPSHPELLDWLAVEFVETGWDVKRLVKLIVMSETYRQSSVATPDLLARDPQNRLLARGSRFRLSAELIRDAALKTSGLLVPRLGGPSVNPYMPGDLWREVSHYGSSPATAQTFVQDHGEKLYRRSLYTYWKRTAPPPNMSAFDAPNREVCSVARSTTTTPLQALVTLNDPQFVEAARAFASRILKKTGDDESRLQWAFAEALSRRPSESELPILRKALLRERRRYADDPDAADAVLAVGESPRDADLSPAEHAAWTQVASLLLNLSEAITRN